MLALLTVAAYAQSSGAFLSPGPLAQAHADIDTVTQCTACHAPLRGIDPPRCLACHDRVAQQVASGTGFHGNKGQSCGGCHADHRGRDADLVQLRADTFDHRETGFELTGRHAEIVCEDCHVPGKDWSSVANTCDACHREIHGASRSRRTLLARCEVCHTTGGWRTEIPPSLFDHTDREDVDYVLTGAHVPVPCVECHFDLRFVPTAHERCVDCHDDAHRAPFGGRCEDCHRAPTSWVVPGFDHRRTGYTLEGLHSEAPCASCHRGHVSVRVPHDGCPACHTDVHRGQFAPEPCDTCHTVTTKAFAIPDWDHSRGDFRLRGAHLQVSCDQCHGAGPDATFRPRAHDDCDACHTDPHDAQFEPTPCQVCHAEEGWAVRDFDHARTEFPLEGRHAALACEACHAGGRYERLSHDSCADCHTGQPHAFTFTRPCGGCHDPSGFDAVRFAHAAQTSFALTAPHDELRCTACHTQILDFTGLGGGCASCHADDRPRDHFPGACDDCHAGEAWTPAGLGGLDHRVTGFPLRGQHAMAPCEGCHVTPGSRGATPDTCAGCHRVDDPHRNLLGDRCEDCHSETSWFRTRFRHQQTGWPLVGQHRVAECDACHAVAFVGTPTDCWRCHEADASPDVPAHQSVFFATCDECHTPYAWAAVRFAH